MKACQVFLDKNGISFYIVLTVEILTVILASVGVLEREAVLAMTGLMVFYFIFNKVEDSLILFIISIPLFIALPIESYDSMANWRILLAILFLVWFFKHRWSQIRTQIFTNFRSLFAVHCSLSKLVILFLIIGALSLFVATDLVVGVKKILFLINIFLLYIIIRNVVAQNKEMVSRIIKAGAVAGIISLIVGYSQLVSIFFKPLYTFWQWWAKNVISVFYGINLSKLLANSNTWFSYYENSPPTLRMFSVFPDSHSFALFMIIGLMFFSYLLFRKKWHSLVWVIIILSFLALVFSGSRGVWVSAAIPFSAVIFVWIFKNIRKNVGLTMSHIKPFLGMLLIFLLALPMSSLILSKSYQGAEDTTLAFKRAKTVIDIEELSVKNRMEIWKASFQSILRHPLSGIGIGNYPVVLDEDISAAKKGASAHNLYLDVASEMGLLGLTALLLIFWQILKKSLQLQQLQHYNIIFPFFLLWIFIYSLFDVVLLNDKVLLFFMVALALLYGKE